MLTNKIKVDLNIKMIDADFDVFEVEKSNKDYQNNILDMATYEFKAAAVQWTFGAKALVLFRKKTVTEQQFEDSIKKEYADVKIKKINLFDEEQCSKCFYFQNRLLAQLLINSMWVPKNKAFMYNNLTGKLLYHNSSWKKKTSSTEFIYFLEVIIAPGMYLYLQHKTFRTVNKEYNKKPSYVFDPYNGEFRRKLKTDTNVTIFQEGSLSGSHFKVDNLNIKDYDSFEKSKMGVMN